MRFTPVFAGLLLASTAALAQPAPGGGPGYDQGPPAGDQGPPPGYQGGPPPGDQGGPPPGYQGPPPGYQGPPPGGPDQGGPPPMGEEQRPHGGAGHFIEKFEAANVTHDGRLTLAQAEAAHMGMVARNFAQIDADHKGYVTLQDIKIWHRTVREQRMQQQSSPPPAPPPPQ